MRSRRHVFYFVVGTVLTFVGIGVILFGTIRGATHEQMAGILVFIGGIVLMFQARLTRLRSRLNAVEEYLRQQTCSGSGKYLAEDEEEPPAA